AMKNKKYIYSILAAGLMAFAMQSCYQDLGQTPGFDYPQQPPKAPIDETGQIFHASFNVGFKDTVSGVSPTVVGTPTLSTGIISKAYTGATGAYLTFKLSDLKATFGTDFTIGFWYKVNGTPDRAGIIVVGPPTSGAGADAQNNRTSGFRIFRENADGKQRIKANVGDGTGDTWLDGGSKGDVDPATAGWKYITLTMTTGTATFYIDGDVVATSSTFAKISWTGCDIMSIGSGAPRFTEWGHYSDLSRIDDIRIYSKALTAAQIKEIVNHESDN
ncbi:MAG: hypothetical protein BGN96_07995, partial [Bacteroidales bacterium 45-6]